MSESNVPKSLLYTAEHEWIRDEGDGVVWVGITDYAQDSLGDITYIELPEIGAEITAGEGFGVVESVKTFSDLYAPVNGEVVEINSEAVDDPSSINEDPYGAWLIKVRITDPSELDDLLDPDGYREHLETAG